MARWMDTMNRLHDPLVARVVLEFMDNSAGMRDRFPGAHLLALETVKRDRMRFAKAERRKTLVLNALRYVGGLLWSGVKLATRKAPAVFSARTESCPSPTSVESVHRSLRARLQERSQQPSSATRRG
jgi:hypothetical protein